MIALQCPRNGLELVDSPNARAGLNGWHKAEVRGRLDLFS